MNTNCRVKKYLDDNFSFYFQFKSHTQISISWLTYFIYIHVLIFGCQLQNKEKRKLLQVLP